MGYRIAEGEPAGQGLRRCVVEQLDRATDQLVRGLEEDPERGVHEARKALKRARSGLRLGREVFGAKRVRAELDALRETAGRLSAARDADVGAKLLRELSAEGVGRLPEAAWRRLEEAFAPGATAPDGAGLAEAAGAARAELEAVRGRIAGWPLPDPDAWAAVVAGVRRAQRRGRRELKGARSGEDVEARHELRKRVKDAWYELSLLEELWPAALRAQADEAHRLSNLLGDEHDLDVLAGRLAGLTGVPVDVEPALELIAHRREALWAEAVPLARRLYAERPRALARRLAAYREVGSSPGSTSSSAATGRPTTLR